jgi:hypothetical protein
VPIVGIAVAFIWLSAARAVLSGHANGFVRAGNPESGAVRALTVPVDSAGAYFVYVEGSGVETLRDLEVQVTGPSGRAVPVRAVAPRPEYLHDWRGGLVVGGVASRYRELEHRPGCRDRPPSTSKPSELIPARRSVHADTDQEVFSQGLLTRLADTTC